MIRRSVKFVLDNSLLLIVGAVAAMLWANLHDSSYLAFVQGEWLKLDSIGERTQDGMHFLNTRFVVNDILMALFFALAGREVWTAVLPGGHLATWRKAALPLVCAMGGMAGPSLVYLLGVYMMGEFNRLHHGWAVPCATDIAFSYLTARIIFGNKHGAVSLLLLLAIVDDALGMAVLAIFYPVHDLHLGWLLLSVAGVMTGLLLHLLKVYSFVWYILLAGGLSWAGFALSGLHPALGLLPIVPTIPTAQAGHWHRGWDVLRLTNARSQMEYWLKPPVEVILGLFGLTNAGVLLTGVGGVMWPVLLGLLIGKPIGIFTSGWVCTKYLGLQLPDKIGYRDLFIVGCAAGIGFTVALFVAMVAFKEGPVQASAKMGALLSFTAAIIAWVVSKLWPAKPVEKTRLRATAAS